MADDVTLPGTGVIVAADEIAGKKHQRVKVQHGEDGSAVDASAANPFPVTVIGGGAGDASAANQTTMIGHLDGLEGALASILAKIIASPATAANQTTVITALGNILAKIITAPATEALQTALNTLITTANGYLSSISTAAGDTTTPLPVKGQAPITRLTPTILTSAYTTGTVLFATTSIANLVPANDQPVVLESLFVVDKDDEGVAITLHFFSANVALGTAGSAPSISDADAASAWLGSVDIVTGDYKDLGGVKVASLKGIGLNLAPAAGTRNVYVAATVTGTPTFTSAGDLVFGFGVLG